MHTVLVTGAAGYVGALLVKRFAARSDVERVIAIDRAPIPDAFRAESKLVYLQTNTADDWEDKVRAYHPDVVIHAAWQVRELYGAQDMQRRWNLDGSDKVFAYALSETSVKRLIHFSTVASYGALAANDPNHFFIEDEPLRPSDYRYAEEKRIAEERLREAYVNRLNKHVTVAVLRPASITGPGALGKSGISLQSMLRGKLPFAPVTKSWLRQFVHEEDVVNITEQLAFTKAPGAYEIFNLCPPGPVVRGADIAKAVGKRALVLPSSLVRFVFFLAWHFTQGAVPTSRGLWKSYSYPIAVDGSKVTRLLGYDYRHSSQDALAARMGSAILPAS